MISKIQQQYVSKILSITQCNKCLYIYIYPMGFFSNIFSAILIFLGIKQDPNQYNSKFTFPCLVNNCEQCTFTNFCGLCSNNYILTLDPTTSQPFCQAVACDISNCYSCLADNICQQCNGGYSVTQSGKCSRSYYYCSVQNCLACSQTNQNVCELCTYGYYASQINGQCYPISGNQVGNCSVAFQYSSFMCQICKSGYVVNPAYQCYPYPTFSCDVDNCFICTSNNYCGTCMSGFNETNGGCAQPICNTQNCAYCVNSTTCGSCQNNYAISNNKCLLKTYGCNVANCIICAQYPQICSRCEPGYQSVYQFSENNKTLQIYSICQKITKSEGGQVPVTNCNTFGVMLPGTSELSIGCVQCQTNFQNVGGYCVANLELSSYSCDISNCLYCIGDNVCGKCQSGFYLVVGSYSQCVKSYSPFPNCAQTALFQAACAQCEPQYMLSVNLTCIHISQEVSCEIPGCQYCTEDAICAQCRTGFTFQQESDSCEPICSINNCYQCGNQTLCDICNSGYILANNNTECNPISQNPSTQCSNTQIYGQGCLQCQNSVCLKCADSYTLNQVTQQCCLTPDQNAIGCLQYVSQCSNLCAVCKEGYNKLMNFQGQSSPQCLAAPCPLSNCLFCPQGNQCYVCSQGYTLNNNGTCSPSSPNSCPASMNFCLQCNSQGQCQQCQPGYRLYYGVCVCGMQNCLKCEGSAYCSVCAFPTFASLNGNTQGCSMPFVPYIQCEVSACQECVQPNICSICAQGYSLSSINTCIQNNCSQLDNCLLCSTNQLICYLCQQGYMQEFPLFGGCQFISNSTNKNCNQIIQHCEYCSNQNNGTSTCSSCILGYTLANGVCSKIVCTANCLACISVNQSAVCLACITGFYLTTNNQCNQLNSSIQTNICFDNIPNCVECASQYSCLSCASGLQPSSNSQQCIVATCMVQNCAFCLDGTQNQQCAICVPGYTLTSVGLCSQVSQISVDCDVDSCFSCYLNNNCGRCASPFSQYQGDCVSDINCPTDCYVCSDSSSCSICQQNYQLNTNFQLSSSVCLPACNISNCILCYSFTQCQRCDTYFGLANSNTQCVCGTNFNEVNGSCVCPDGYTIYGNQCFQCNLQNCVVCSSDNQCNSCTNGYQLKNSACQCPQTFVVQGSQCTCPQNYKQNPSTNTCIQCQEQQCQYCGQPNQCSACYLGLFVINGSCTCPDSHTIDINQQCVCPDGTTELGTECVLCPNKYCQQCSEDYYCNVCVSNSFSISNGNCTCQQYYSLYIGNNSQPQCILCQPYYVNQCETCNISNYCQICQQTFVNLNGQCYCPPNTTYSQQLNTCLPCYVELCQLCSSQSADICQQCLQNSILSFGLCISCDIQNCLNCTSNGFCSLCSQGLVPSAQGDFCIKCTLANCMFCSNTNVCQVCQPAYSLTPNTNVCVQCLLDGCVLCYTPNVCATCAEDYQLQVTGICTACPYPCKTCNTTNPSICLTCMYPFSQTPSNGYCIPCQTIYCLECSNSSVCTQCIQGYSLSNNSCVLSLVLTNGCRKSQQNSCVACYSHYTLKSGQCIACQDTINCISCNPDNVSLCTKCDSGFYSSGGICSQCPFTNCLTCNKTQCFTFQSIYGQFALTVNNIIMPVVCDSYCELCSQNQPTYCLKCSLGYTLSQSNTSSYCIPCPSPCLTCSPDLSQCYSCSSEYYLNTSSSQCISCSNASNCYTCSSSSANSCTSCPVFFMMGNMSCTSYCDSGSIQYCMACKEDDFCEVCIDGYTANQQGQCVPCLFGCSLCSQQINQCIVASPGFYFNQQANICYSCSGQCQICLNSKLCLSCYDGYILLNNQCENKCPYPCATCNSATCFSCIAGYSLGAYSNGNNFCYLETAYYSQNVLNSYCPYQYALSGGICQKCVNLTQNCVRCNPNTLSQCIACAVGYYLDMSKNVCSACSTGCLTCTNAQTCLSCQQYYVAMPQPISKTNKQCILCQSPCLTCTNTPITCLSCQIGSQLVGSRCVPLNYFDYMVQLNVNMGQFYSNYYNFVSSIASAIQTNQFQNVLVNKIVSGSVTVNGFIVPQKDSIMSLSDQQAQLYDLFSGGSIANMQILASSLTYGGITVTQPYSVNVGLIVGLTIGLSSLVAIVVVIGIIYHNKKRQRIEQILIRNSQAIRRQTHLTLNTNIRQKFDMENNQIQMQKI